jgi:hypothetical protein
MRNISEVISASRGSTIVTSLPICFVIAIELVSKTGAAASSLEETAHMSEYKYRSGQVVEPASKVFAFIPPGRYEVVRLMPPTMGGNNQYRIKALRDGHERVVKEGELVGTLVA